MWDKEREDRERKKEALLPLLLIVANTDFKKLNEIYLIYIYIEVFILFYIYKKKRSVHSQKLLPTILH